MGIVQDEPAQPCPLKEALPSCQSFVPAPLCPLKAQPYVLVVLLHENQLFLEVFNLALQLQAAHVGVVNDFAEAVDVTLH